MGKEAHEAMMAVETAAATERPLRRRPGRKPGRPPKPKGQADNGHQNGTGRPLVDPVAALRQHLERLAVDSQRLAAESARTKRALQALEG